jgi:hypothetical protein
MINFQDSPPDRSQRRLHDFFVKLLFHEWRMDITRQQPRT